MTTISSVAGLTANCTFEPPVSTPTARITAIAWSRSIWYWRSVSVCCGATVTESPVWTPIGSTFSIEQTMTTLSAPSRMTSSSNSPQPSTDSSMSTCPIGEAASPRATIRSTSSGVRAIPPPRPPRVKAGRTMSGSPNASSAAWPSSTVVAIRLRAVRSPAACIVASNSSRSSARQMASYVAPISSTSKRSSVPFSCRALARFSAVWPPSVGSSASGRSRSMTWATGPGSSGST
jgi:hypothetical protein